jgi:putative transposase
MGELKKLEIKPPSRSTVKRILKEHKLEPGPKSGPGTWDEFIRMHAETLWQADFFSRLIWTRKALRQCYLRIRRRFDSAGCGAPSRKLHLV